ncbi:hypothetical protein [Salinimicrobium soli]|uniref:hypothetical protein n=1 Tax=Salinimicrobium soli TaxID=1254399 RepID=UPI003AAEC688
MKTILYKVLFALVLVPAISCANNGYKGKYTKQKKLKKEYTVSAKDLLKIDNSYGNVDVTTWDQNRVVIEVFIETNGNNEEKVEERLKEIDVRFQQSNGTVSARTLFEKENNSFWNSLFGGSSNVNMEINYRVKAPVTNNVDLSNDYGSINLDRLEGNAKISCDYGRIMVGELLGDDNMLSFDYTRNSSIHYVKRAKISADYSEFSIDEAGTVNLNADYTDSYFEKVENLGFSCDYGSLKVEKLRNIKGSGDYLGVKLGLIYGSANLGMDYGSLAIEKLMGSLKELDLSTDYTSVKIGYDRDAPFSFEVRTSYGGIKGLDNSGFTLNKKNQSSTDRHYEGYYKSANAGGKVRINSSYGSVSFED